MIIQISVGIFLLLEFSNVIALYFRPENKNANAMAPFTVWSSTKDDKPIHDLLRYMSYWVAGTKLIFISLLMVILVFASTEVQFYSLIVLIFSILTYYWKLSPLIRKMDEDGHISPPGYAYTLDKMIMSFVLVLSIAGILHLIFGL